MSPEDAAQDENSKISGLVHTELIRSTVEFAIASIHVLKGFLASSSWSKLSSLWKYFKKEGKDWGGKPQDTVMQTRLQNHLRRLKGYGILSNVMEVTAREIDCSTTEILFSNQNHRAKLSAASKTICSPKTKVTLENYAPTDSSRISVVYCFPNGIVTSFSA